MSTGFYHCSVKPVGRANGRSVVAAAAYRAGERLHDERTGETFDYRARGGVADSLILTPDDAPAWATDRAQLWSRAELAESRANGRLATELELALPHELSPAQRRELVSEFVRGFVHQHGVAADVAIHVPGQGSDHRNHHAHVLITHREIGPEGFGDLSNRRTVTRKRKGQEVQETIAGIAATPVDVRAIRQAWERDVNRAYERAGLDIRVDHRSHEDRGLEEKPTKHLGPTAAAMERDERASDRGDVNREITQRNAERRELTAFEAQAVALKSEIIIVQRFGAAAQQTAEPAAPIWDRDQALAAAIARNEALQARGLVQGIGQRSSVSEPRIAHRATQTAGSLASFTESLLSGLFGMAVAEPMLTRQQLRDQAKAATNEEALHARAVEAEQAEKAAEYDERHEQQKKTAQEQDLRLSQRYGTPVTREANLGRERDEDHERER